MMTTSPLFYEESYTIPQTYDLRLVPIITIVGSMLFWKLLIPFYAVVCIFLLIVVAVLAYYLREAKVTVLRDVIEFKSGIPSIPFPLSQLKSAVIAGRRPGGGYAPLNLPEAPPLKKVWTLPMSLPTYLFFRTGVLIEGGEMSPYPYLFIPSNNPEQLLKAIQDTRRF